MIKVDKDTGGVTVDTEVEDAMVKWIQTGSESDKQVWIIALDREVQDTLAAINERIVNPRKTDQQ